MFLVIAACCKSYFCESYHNVSRETFLCSTLLENICSFVIHFYIFSSTGLFMYDLILPTYLLHV